jgi:HlyD family secretion protein
MEARVKVDETDVPRIGFGDSAFVRIDAFPGQTFNGQVTRVSNSALQTAGGALGAAGGGQAGAQSVDFEVLITLKAPPSRLRPDLSATADIVTARRPKAISIPILALTVRDPDGKKPRQTAQDDAPPGATRNAQTRRPDAQEVEGVFTVQEGKATWTPVRVGVVGERYFEVVSGLQGGETVVAGPYQAIRDLQHGDPVKVPPPPKERDKESASASESE